jgi:hypothetical protein
MYSNSLVVKPVQRAFVWYYLAIIQQHAIISCWIESISEAWVLWMSNRSAMQLLAKPKHTEYNQQSFGRSSFDVVLRFPQKVVHPCQDLIVEHLLANNRVDSRRTT